MKLTAIGITALLLALPNAWAGEYYKWVDDNGVSHFSERPPQDTNAKAQKLKTVVRAAPQTDSSAESNEPSPGSPQANSASLKNAHRCEVEQERLKTLTSGARIRMQDDNGKHYYLDTKAIEHEAAKSRKAIQESC